MSLLRPLLARTAAARLALLPLMRLADLRPLEFHLLADGDLICIAEAELLDELERAIDRVGEILGALGIDWNTPFGIGSIASFYDLDSPLQRERLWAETTARHPAGSFRPRGASMPQPLPPLTPAEFAAACGRLSARVAGECLTTHLILAIDEARQVGALALEHRLDEAAWRARLLPGAAPFDCGSPLARSLIDRLQVLAQGPIAASSPGRFRTVALTLPLRALDASPALTRVARRHPSALVTVTLSDALGNTDFYLRAFEWTRECGLRVALDARNATEFAADAVAHLPADFIRIATPPPEAPASDRRVVAGMISRLGPTRAILDEVDDDDTLAAALAWGAAALTGAAIDRSGSSLRGCANASMAERLA